MEVLERHSGNDASGTIFDCVDGSLDFINMLFGVRGVHNDIFYQLVYSIVELHVHKNSFY